MVDTFSILLSHGLIGFALWRLLARDDLDRETDAWISSSEQAETEPTGWGARDA